MDGKRAVFLAAALFVMLGFTRLWVVQCGDLNHDEAFLVDMARTPTLGGMMERLREKEFHPPLQYLLHRVWLTAGDSEEWIRALPAGLNVLTILLVAALACRHFSPWSGTAAGIFMALSPYQLKYGSEARMYSLLQFLAVVCWFAAIEIKAARPMNQRRLILLYGLASTAMIYTHYYGFFVCFLVFLFLLVPGSRTQPDHVDCSPDDDPVRASSPKSPHPGKSDSSWNFRLATLAHIMPAIAFLPWIPGAIEASRSQWPSVMPPFSMWSILEFPYKTLAGNYYVPPSEFLWTKGIVGMLLLAGTMAAAGAVRREGARGPHGALLCASWLYVLTTYLFALKFGTFIPKYIIASAPFFAILAGLGVESAGAAAAAAWEICRGAGNGEIQDMASSRTAFFIGVLVSILAFIVTVSPFIGEQMSFLATNWSAVSRHLRSNVAAGDRIFVSLPGRVVSLNFYLPGIGSPMGLLPSDLPKEGPGFLEGLKRAWLLLEHRRVKDPQDLIIGHFRKWMKPRDSRFTLDSTGVTLEVHLFEGK